LYHLFLLNVLLLLLVAVDCFPVAGICCNGQVHTGYSVGFRLELPCKWTSVHLDVVIYNKFDNDNEMTIFIYTLAAKRPDSRTKLC